RQRHPRVTLEARVIRYDAAHDQPQHWRTVNISEGGMFVRGGPILSPGTELDVGLWLPSANEDRPRSFGDEPLADIEVVSRARVVWNNDPANPESRPDLPAGMGLEIISI